MTLPCFFSIFYPFHYFRVLECIEFQRGFFGFCSFLCGSHQKFAIAMWTVNRGFFKYIAIALPQQTIQINAPSTYCRTNYDDASDLRRGGTSATSLPRRRCDDDDDAFEFEFASASASASASIAASCVGNVA